MAVVLLLTGTPVNAGDHRWWHDASVQLRLGLTAAQVSRIDRIFNSDRPARIARLRQLERRVSSLRVALASGDVERIQRDDLVARIERLRMRINVQRTMMLVKIYRELSVTQRTELSRLKLQNPE